MTSTDITLSNTPARSPELNELLAECTCDYNRDACPVHMVVTDDRDMIPRRSSVAYETEAAVLFEEMRKIALGFIHRTDIVERQANLIIATMFVNLKRHAEQGDKLAISLFGWIEPECEKLAKIRAEYEAAT